MSHTTSILALFPGQGSQKVGMGKALYEASPIGRDFFERADRVLGFSLSSICFEGPEDKLRATEIAQPAILTVSSICYALAVSKAQNSFKVAGGAGHSLGEYSALVAAGALKFEDACLLVHKRGRYMQEAVPLGEGKMVAVLGKELSEIEEALKKVKGVCEVANINAPGQIVVAGQRGSIEEFVAKFSGAKIIELPVSAPFHCALMQPAEEKLAKDLDALQIEKASFSVYANFSAKAVVAPHDIRASLKAQVCGRVRWVECMENVIRETAPQAAIEFGSGNVLSGLLKRIAPALKRLSADSVESVNELATSLAVG